MADVFETPPERNQQAIDVQVAARERLWKLIVETPSLDWLLLTKRPENIKKLAPWRALIAEDRYDGRPVWPHNVWIGTTVEDQKRAEERIPWLLEVPAAVRFVSAEPLLESLDLENVSPYYLRREITKSPYEPILLIDALRGHVKGPDDMLDWHVDWVIVGGESGAGARPFNPTWAKTIIGQCRAAKVPVFMKQLGANVLDFAGAITDRKGGDPSEWPEELCVQQFPTTHVTAAVSP
jgi:protein gp37